MSAFWGQAIAPFLLFAMLLVARPFKRAAQRMKDGKLKRFLLWRIRSEQVGAGCDAAHGQRRG